MTVDINSRAFDDKTLLKLDIFRDCFVEWFPVFLNNPYVNRIYIMDLFAGSGGDAKGNLGSPLLLLDEVKGADAGYCKQAENNRKVIKFWFNELDTDKVKKLKKNVDDFITRCEKECSLDNCYFRDKILITGDRFEDIFNSGEFRTIASRRDYGKFLVLDQYGFKEIGDEEFKQLITYPKLDFIFFITSHVIRRFKQNSRVVKYIDSTGIDFDDDPKKIHSCIADHYRSLIPAGMEYYIHHFSIMKGPNRYGLIFGSGHTYGMEKFLDVCWRKDIYAGESDEIINNDWTEGMLFSGVEPPNKIREVKKDVQQQILNGNITDNVMGLKYTLKRGCLGNVYFDAVEELKDNEKILIEGNFNRKKKGIHTIKGKDVYRIKVKEQ